MVWEVMYWRTIDGVDVATWRSMVSWTSAACREIDVMDDVMAGMIVVRQVALFAFFWGMLCSKTVTNSCFKLP